jgi:hypothetical protein
LFLRAEEMFCSCGLSCRALGSLHLRNSLLERLSSGDDWNLAHGKPQLVGKLPCLPRVNWLLHFGNKLPLLRHHMSLWMQFVQLDSLLFAFICKVINSVCNACLNDYFLLTSKESLRNQGRQCLGLCLGANFAIERAYCMDLHLEFMRQYRAFSLTRVARDGSRLLAVGIDIWVLFRLLGMSKACYLGT